MPDTPGLDRRTLFGLAGASLLSRPATVRRAPAMAIGGQEPGTVLATPIRDSAPALNVAGPRDGELAAWARRLAPALAAGLMEHGRLDLRYSGGVDGVTGTNQFDARAAPDGREALLLPGSVALDYLAGQRPLRFDPARVLPLLAVFGGGVLMVRGARPAAGGAPLRLAGGTPQDGLVVALLGLDLMGIAAIRAARDSEADAVFLYGPQAASRAAALRAAGYAGAFCTGEGQGGVAQPLPFLAGIADARRRRDPLVAAWHALAGAADLCAALVLPRLCPAASIGRWRQAAASGLSDEGVIGQARRDSLRLVAGEGAAAALAPMRLASGPQIALRRWLSDRADLRAG